MLNTPPNNTYIWLVQIIAFLPLAITSYTQYRKTRSGVSVCFYYAMLCAVIGGLIWFVPHLLTTNAEILTYCFVVGDFFATIAISSLAMLTPLIFVSPGARRSIGYGVIAVAGLVTWIGSAVQLLPDNTFVNSSGVYVYVTDYTIFSVIYTALYFAIIPAGIYFIQQSFRKHGRARVRAFALGSFLAFGALLFGSEGVIRVLFNSPNAVAYLGLVPFAGLILSSIWVLFYSKKL